MIIELNSKQLSRLRNLINRHSWKLSEFCYAVNVTPQTLSRQLKTGKFEEKLFLKYLKELRIISTVIPYIKLNKLENWVMTLPSKHTILIFDKLIND